MRSSRGFASAATDFLALFRLAFASTPPHNGLIWPVTASRRIIMQKARRHPDLRHWAPTACKHVVSGSMSSPPGILSTFRSRYWFTIGRQGVFSLAGWAPRIQTRFHVSGPTQVPTQPTQPVAYGTVTLFGPASQRVRLGLIGLHIGPTTPVGHARPVWALPLSLAATDGIEVSFSSCSY